jgi:hypothetical protein
LTGPSENRHSSPATGGRINRPSVSTIHAWLASSDFEWLKEWRGGVVRPEQRGTKRVHSAWFIDREKRRFGSSRRCEFRNGVIVVVILVCNFRWRIGVSWRRLGRRQREFRRSGHEHGAGLRPGRGLGIRELVLVF